ncbi:TIGR03915 family putative DNA repair protein [Psychroserpens sp. BH13MA-6]
MQERHLIYDGTFDGFLSCIFYIYEHNLDQVHIQNEFEVQERLFSEFETVITDIDKANRVWKGLKSKLSKMGCYQLYYAFLSEEAKIENTLLSYVRYAFSNQLKADKNYANPYVLKVAQTAKKVGREKHRMEAFVRFRLTKDQVYFASIEPDFNVLPLISKHFKRRYADQKWMIYDIKRRYGLYYDLNTVEIIQMAFPEDFDMTKNDTAIFTAQELEFQKLWQDYFKSTNIESRKNMKLHVRHVPKRYWKYLSEKQPN